MSQIYFQHTTPSHIKFEVSCTLFVSRKLNSRNSVSSFFNVWQPSRKLIKEKLIPVNKEIAFTRRKVFSFPCQKENTFLFLAPLIKHIFTLSASLSKNKNNWKARRFWKNHTLQFMYFFPQQISVLFLYIISFMFSSSSYFLDLQE